ncbi:DUF1659 domain-containing protein [Tissierella sp. MSJ-40]|uniref:DUF1659 domain-containing protein n=1 Tax=Tissierella simiarum TaxID=2841534 RepID=A0ABS6E1B7_9FIRM|nr:DUF1659 domain-containing protein [Tissierella simiarum]MBU5436687.1 DUF1659 domain-containing protein [Tissierella simiarum]
MAIQEIKENTTLKIELDGGTVDGKQKIKSKTFNKVKVTAENQELFKTATALANLQSKDLLKVKRIEEVVLKEE